MGPTILLLQLPKLRYTAYISKKGFRVVGCCWQVWVYHVSRLISCTVGGLVKKNKNSLHKLYNQLSQHFNQCCSHNETGLVGQHIQFCL